ncbi:extracellular solute-binding protein [Streptomyces sp. GC420]|uniref:extracellular solute-binding protein n=1 Tax=Streptomyces sp. GC420 TaxID=2697568 RepID=UPI001414D26A|nr:extracellular solute-binding protein [Streptomyces sp. GC420]NBM15749.1 extracellular solute-binding protein [Streptomyces sp. GC420]
MNGARRAVRPRRAPRRGRLAAALLLVLLAACSGGEDGGQAGPAPRCASPTGRPVLRIATGRDFTSSGIRQRLIRAWDRRNETVDVEIVQLSDDADRQRGQLVAALQAGNQDCYDIVNLDVTWTAEFAEQGLISPLEEPLDEDIWPAVRATADYEDDTWAVPWNTDVGLLYYRADLLGRGRDLGTWDRLERTAASFDRERDPRVTSGLITQLGAYEGLTVNVHEAVWRQGGRIVDEDGTVRAGEARAVEGLAELTEAFDSGGGAVPLLGPESLDSDETESVVRFVQGEALAMRNWPFALGRLADDRRKDGTADNAEFGVTTLPGGAAALGGQNLALVAGSVRQRQARDLIAHLTSEEAGRCLYAGGFVPAREAALRGECDERLVDGGLPDRDEIPDALFQEYESALRTSLGKAAARPVTPYYAAVTRDIQRHVHPLLRTALDGGEPQVGATAEKLTEALRTSVRGR